MVKFYVDKTLSLMNCTPPWMTPVEDLWCRHHVHLTEALREEVLNLFQNIIDDNANKRFVCKPSCQSIR